MMARKERIAVLAIHFGPLPGTMPLWIRSVSANPDVDFIFITDQDVVSNSGNLKILRSSLADTRELISSKLGVAVALSRPYKLCDYRPMYGVVFEDILKGYDFWGHCDLDVAFGHIRKFLTPEVLRHDKVLVRGNFSLYRNSLLMNNLFRRDGAPVQWGDVVRTEANCHFDEWPGIYKIACAAEVSLYREEIISDIGHKRWRLLSNDLSGRRVELHYWQAGSLFRAIWTPSGMRKEERLLIHLQKRPYKQDIVDLSERDLIVFLPAGCEPVSAEDISLSYAKQRNGPNVIGDASVFYRKARAKMKKWLSSPSAGRRA